MSYKDLKSYRQAKIISDFTAKFCDRYIKSWKQKDQMKGAGRSGKQNISEGQAQNDEGGELKLTKVARGSLEELLEDYEDFLRQKGLAIWEKDSAESREVRRLVYEVDRIYRSHRSNRTNKGDRTNRNNEKEGRGDWRREAHKEAYKLYEKYLDEPQEAANVMVCLINQTNYLLDNQIDKLEQKPPMSARDRWFKKRAKKKRKQNRDFIKNYWKKKGLVYTKRGVMDKEEAERRGLEPLDIP